MAVITLDFETHWSKDYSLTKMNEVDYILSPLFQVILCAVKVGHAAVEVYSNPRDIEARLSQVDWGKTALLSHNTRFDGAILAWHYGYTPALYLDTLGMARALTHAELGSSSLAAVAHHMGLPPKGDEVVGAMGRRREDFTPAELARYALYCAHDTELCWQIFQKFMNGRYNFPKSELGVIDLALRMFIEPMAQLDATRLAEHLHRVRAEKERLFHNQDRSVFASNPQFAALLTEHGVVVPRKVSPTTGEITWALARGDREFKRLCEDPTQPLAVQVLLMQRLGAKSTIEETRSARLLDLARRDWPGRGTGWCPIPYTYYGAHCVPGDTEVLTRDGWIALEHWDSGEIAQVYPDQTIEFLPATRYLGPVVGQWVGVRAPYLRCDFTLGHTIPRLMQHHYSWGTLQAANLLDRSFIWTPLAGRLTATGAITPKQMRALAMVQADGHWETDSAQGRGLYIFVKKLRKIERTRYVLGEAGVPFRESEFPSQPGYVRFSVAWRDLPQWLTPERKRFGAWLLNSTPEAREALMQELQHWDGTVHGGQVSFSTSVRENADWIVTLAHLTGRCASVSVHHHRGDDGYTRAETYRVQLRQRNFGKINNEHSELLSKLQQAYCATTQTGFFLARSHGRIFVTGNTGRFSGAQGFNFANLPRASPIRGAIVAPEGFRIVHRDASQVECRTEAAMAQCRALLEGFRTGRDVYSEFASRFYQREITKADVKERFVGKTCVLALGYSASAERFRHALFIGQGGVSVSLTQAAAEDIVAFYRSVAYPEIPMLWEEAGRILRTMLAGRGTDTRIPAIRVEPDRIILPNGLNLKYPDLRESVDPASARREITYRGPKGERKKLYGAKLVENITQALARIIITDVMRRVYDQTGYRPFMGTYDSWDYVIPESEVERFDAILLREFEAPVAWLADVPLASEGGWGRTLAEAEQGANR